MKKQIFVLPIIIALINVTTYAMERAHNNKQLDQLPKHELNIIASFVKRPGKDTLRCVNKTLNLTIISQDRLHKLYEKVKPDQNKNEKNRLWRYNNCIPNQHGELLTTIGDNNTQLAHWCLCRMPVINGAFHDKCTEAAGKNGNIELVKILLFLYPNDEARYYQANQVVLIAAKNGHLNLITNLINSYKDSIDFATAIELAKRNNHQEIIAFLKQHKPSWRYNFFAKVHGLNTAVGY